MAKQTAASEAKERPYKTTGVHLPADQWELLTRISHRILLRSWQ